MEIISRSISTKVWDRAGIELTTPGSAVRHASVVIFGTLRVKSKSVFINLYPANIFVLKMLSAAYIQMH